MLLELGLAAAACFGAASRDPEVPCTNPALERTVTPSLAAARTLPNSPCRGIAAGSPSVCRFGDPRRSRDGRAGRRQPRGPLAGGVRPRGEGPGLAGPLDHPLELPAAAGAARPARAAADAVPALEARRVRVVRAPPRGDDGVRGRAVRAGRGSRPRGGHSRFETAVRGYADAWAALGERRVVVLRDTPRFRGDTDRCIARALRPKRAPGTACARAALVRAPPRPRGRRRGAYAARGARPDAVLLRRALLPGDRRRARRARRQPHDRDLLGDARAVRPARAHGFVTASVNVSAFV